MNNNYENLAINYWHSIEFFNNFDLEDVIRRLSKVLR